MENLKLSADLLRETLGSINFKEKKIDSPELAQDAEAFYNKNFKEILDTMISDQIIFTATKTENTEQFLFGRGTINGLILIREWFQGQVNTSLSRFTEEEEKQVD